MKRARFNDRVHATGDARPAGGAAIDGNER